MKEQIFSLHYPWDKNGYCPFTEFHLSADQKGFHMHIFVQERNPRREETKHLHFVHTDSCVEWFVNFAPTLSDRYFNFEVNPNGVMYASFRKDRFDYQLLTINDILTMNIDSQVHDNNWEVSYTVPYTLIQNYLSGYRVQNNTNILANFYKCGDLTPFPHYGMWNIFYVNPPDFHKPEYFGKIKLLF